MFGNLLTVDDEFAYLQASVDVVVCSENPRIHANASSAAMTAALASTRLHTRAQPQSDTSSEETPSIGRHVRLMLDQVMTTYHKLIYFTAFFCGWVYSKGRKFNPNLNF
jgi:hypothetical protein